MSTENVIGPSGHRRKRRGRRVSQALTKIAQRSLDVNEDDVRTYIPTELDLQIAESMVAGALSFKEVAEAIKVDATTVSRAMKDPLRCAWLSHQLHRIVAKRIGLVDAALMRQALSGDVRAIKLYYDRFAEIIHRSIILTGKLDFDPSKLSDADLDAVIHSEQSRVVETTFTVKEKPCDTPPSSSESPPAAPDTK